MGREGRPPGQDVAGSTRHRFPIRVHEPARRHFPSLTGIRFLAALAVVLSHLHHYGVLDITAAGFRLVDGGRNAVTLFFVLSGFVLAVSYPRLADRAAIAKFWVNRFARIYPTVLVSLALAAISVVWALREPSGRLLRDWFSLTEDPVLWLVLSGIAQLLMLTGWIPVARLNQPWNSPAWSISNEMCFYLLFPVILWLFSRARTRTILLWMLAALLAQGALIAVIARTAGPRGGFLVAQFPPVHLAEFVVGAGCGVLLTTRTTPAEVARRYPKARPILVTTSVVALAVLSVWQPIYPAYYPLTPWFALLIVGLALPTARPSVLGSRPLVRLGEGSYAFYLIHIPLTHLYVALTPVRAWWLGLAFLGVLILIADVTYRWAETPARRRIRAVAARRGLA